MSAQSHLASLILPARSPSLGPASSLRCDHCREELCLDVHRYWHMQFCSSDCVTAYQQRLAPETKVKINGLDGIAAGGSDQSRRHDHHRHWRVDVFRAVTVTSAATSPFPDNPENGSSRFSSLESIRAMPLWDIVMIAFAIGSTIAFCFWARIRATSNDG